MRRIILILLIAISVASVWFITMGANSLAEKKVVAQLRDAGFDHVTIGDLSTGPRKTSAFDIKLDDTGIDSLKSVSISSGWLGALTRGDNADITFDKPDIYRQIDHINALLPGLMSLNREMLVKLPKGRLIVRDGRISINTPLGDFQFLFDIVIEPEKEKKRLVTATIKSDQPTMDFASDWRGWIEPDGTMLVDGLIPEIKTNIGPVRLTRGNGWFSLSNAGEYPSLSGQVESGAASLGTLPLQNFAMTMDIARDAITVLTRLHASGAAQTMLSADVTLENDKRQIAFTLTSDDLPSLFNYLDTTVSRDTAILQKNFSGKNNLLLSVDYQLAKRFPGGPYPFDMRGTLDTQEFLSGTFLVYPGTFDMRGSAKVVPEYLPGIVEYFKLPDNAVSGDYIRLDASLQPFISGISAGVENNTGE